MYVGSQGAVGVGRQHCTVVLGGWCSKCSWPALHLLCCCNLACGIQPVIFARPGCCCCPQCWKNCCSPACRMQLLQAALRPAGCCRGRQPPNVELCSCFGVWVSNCAVDAVTAFLWRPSPLCWRQPTYTEYVLRQESAALSCMSSLLRPTSGPGVSVWGSISLPLMWPYACHVWSPIKGSRACRACSVCLTTGQGWYRVSDHRTGVCRLQQCAWPMPGGSLPGCVPCQGHQHVSGAGVCKHLKHISGAGICKHHK